MAKLPGWQPSTNTAMPTMSPQLRSQPAMVRPRTMDFIPLENPAQQMQLGAANAAKYEAIGKTAITAAEVAIEIKQANDDAKTEAVIADFNKWNSQYTFDNTVGSPFAEPGENGAYTAGPWETAQERYEEDSKAYIDDLLEKADIKTPKARTKLTKSIAAGQNNSREKIRKYVNDQRVSQGRSAIMYRAETANSEKEIADAFMQGRNSRLFSPEEAQEEAFKYTKQFRYRKSIQIVDALQDQAGTMTLEEFDGMVDIYEDLFMSQDWGLDVEDATRVIRQLEKTRDVIEDKMDIIHDQRAQNFFLAWLDPEADHAALTEQFSNMPPAAWGDNYTFVTGLVKSAQTDGVGNAAALNAFMVKVRMYGLGDTTYSQQDLMKEAGNFLPSMSKADQGKVLSALRTEVLHVRKQAVDDLDGRIAQVFGYADLRDMSSDARAKISSDPQLSRMNVIALDVFQGIKDELNDPNANMNQDWDAKIQSEILKRMNIPVLYNASGVETDDPAKADVGYTISLLEALSRDTQAYKQQARGYSSNVIDRYSNADMSRFRREFPKYRKEIQGRTGSEPTFVEGRPVSLSTLNAMLRELKIYENLMKRRNMRGAEEE